MHLGEECGGLSTLSEILMGKWSLPRLHSVTFHMKSAISSGNAMLKIAAEKVSVCLWK